MHVSIVRLHAGTSCVAPRQIMDAATVEKVGKSATSHVQVLEPLSAFTRKFKILAAIVKLMVEIWGLQG